MLCTAEKAKLLCPSLEGYENAFIEERLEQIESFIVSYTHNHFCLRGTTRTFEFTAGDFVDEEGIFCPGDMVRLHNTLRDDGVYILDAGGRLGNLTVVGDLALVKYPPDLILVALQMLVYDLESKDKGAVKSERLSRHTVEYGGVKDGSITGYPDSITGGLRRYCKLLR